MLRSSAVPDNSTLVLVSDAPLILSKLEAGHIRQWFRHLQNWRLRNSDKQLSMWRLCSGDIANQLVLMIHRSKARPLSDLFRPPAAAASTPDNKAATPVSGKDTEESSEFHRQMESLLDQPSSSILTSPEAKTMETKTSIVLAQSSEDDLLHFLKVHYGPQELSDSLELLRKIKIVGIDPQAPFATDGPFIAYVYEFSETLEWTHLQRPTEKQLIEIFLAGIYPTALRQKLKDMKFNLILP